MKRILSVVAVAAALGTITAHATEIQSPRGHMEGTFGDLDHVFLIIMENQTNTDILGNANAPFINSYAKVANQATNYFAVGHPSVPTLTLGSWI